MIMFMICIVLVWIKLVFYICFIYICTYIVQSRLVSLYIYIFIYIYMCIAPDIGRILSY